jgi:MFS family permease
MAAGAVAPIFAPNAFGVAIAAASLGGTFIGVTALANALGHELQPQQSQVAIGRLTTVFGIGQIIGPAAAGTLVTARGDYHPALVLAAGVLALSAGVMLAGSLKRAQYAS